MSKRKRKRRPAPVPPCDRPPFPPVAAQLEAIAAELASFSSH